MLEGKNIAAFSKEWRSDWTSNHHVLTALAERNRVLWINSIGMRAPVLASNRDRRRIFGKIRAWLNGPVPVRTPSAVSPSGKYPKAGLYVFTPLVWPFAGPAWLKKLSRCLLKKQILGAVRRLEMEPFQLWTFLPTAEPYVGALGERLSVYYCTDNWRLFPYLNGPEIAACEAKLLRKVDLVFAASHFLRDEKKAANPNTYLITHGVNRIFSEPAAVAPKEIARLKQPRLGFYGWLRETIDQELLCRLAQSFPEATIVLLGKTSGDFTRLSSLANIRFLGQRPYAELPEYAACFDVGLIPYRMQPELMAATNPVKLKEYLALGIPVVSTDLAEVRPYRQACWIAGNTDEFIRAVKEALGPEGKIRAALGREMVKKETWTEKVEEISRILIRNGA